MTEQTRRRVLGLLASGVVAGGVPIAGAGRSDDTRSGSADSVGHDETDVTAREPGGTTLSRGTVGETADASRWAQYGYDATNTSYNPLASGVVTDPDRSWEFATGGDVYGSATHVGGTVYAGSHDGRVYAVDADSGRERWNYPLGGEVVAAPATVDGLTVAAGNDTVIGLDAETGALRWEQTVDGLSTNTPPVVDGTVIASAPGGGAVHAFDLQTGQPLWTTGEFEMPAGMAATNDAVYVTDVSTRYVALSLADGSERWSVDVDAWAKPMVHGDLAVLGGAGEIDAFDVESGDLEWHTTIDGSVVAAPSTDGSVLVANALQENDSTILYAFALDDGEVRWTTTVNAVARSSPGIADGVVYHSGSEFYARDLQSGDLVWQRPASSGPFGSPAVVDGRVFVADVGAGTINAFEDSIAQFDRVTERKVDLAAAIDEISRADLDDREQVEALMAEFSTLLEDGALDHDVAADAVQRLIHGEDIADRTIRAVGPAEYVGGEDYSLARSSAGLTARSIVELVFVKLVAKKLLAERVSRLANDAGLVDWLGGRLGDGAVRRVLELAVDALMETIKRASTWAVSFLHSAIDPDQDATGMATAHRVIHEIEDRLDPIVSDLRRGVADTGSALYERIDDAIETLVDWLAELIRLPVEGVFVRSGLWWLHGGLAPDRVADDGLTGSADGAAAARDYGVSRIDSYATLTAESIATVAGDLSEVDLIGSALTAADAEDPGAFRRAISAIAGFLWDLIGGFRRAAGAYVGWNGILEILLFHYNAIRGVRGGSEPGPLPRTSEIIAILHDGWST